MTTVQIAVMFRRGFAMTPAQALEAARRFQFLLRNPDANPIAISELQNRVTS